MRLAAYTVATTSGCWRERQSFRTTSSRAGSLILLLATYVGILFEGLFPVGLVPRDVNIELTVDEFHHWRFNGREESAVEGCIDVDLNFSPVTNLLPIRRLNLGIGEHSEVKAAWLRFPSFELEPLVQVYTRLDEFRYRYSSSGGEFVRELTVNEVGFITDYPGFWAAD